jgi:transcriptional regulator GlxA family with amidase domain
VKRIAMEVGYGNASALARAFAARNAGLSPLEWLARQATDFA